MPDSHGWQVIANSDKVNPCSTTSLSLIAMTGFGIQIEPQFGFELDEIVKLADLAVENKLATLWFSDHFMLNQDTADRVLLDPWIIMAALSQLNKEVRMGSLVFCNSYRYPPLHAKMGASLDNVSDGRLEFGIGAGWKQLEYQAYGIPFPDDSVRIAQLAEAIQIIRGIWTEEKFSMNGDHYEVKEVVSYPKPVQQPHPTIWVGTMKAGPKMLDVAAEFGDGINIAWSFTPGDTKDIFERLDKKLRQYDRNPDEFKYSVGLWTHVFETDEQMEETIRQNAKSRGISEKEYRERVKSAFWGTPEHISQTIHEYIEFGCDQLIFMFPHEQEEEQIELMGREVLSKL
ncbi:LLM class flavin-dependent oxidoreductase [Candidatus Thorarchaeota archaeon]|nr:MAG: LLM class flavin-dependent oxidoreductase [Candidatus Thorarchaeota archaeon]